MNRRQFSPWAPVWSSSGPVYVIVRVVVVVISSLFGCYGAQRFQGQSLYVKVQTWAGLVAKADVWDLLVTNTKRMRVRSIDPMHTRKRNENKGGRLLKCREVHKSEELHPFVYTVRVNSKDIQTPRKQSRT